MKFSNATILIVLLIALFAVSITKAEPKYKRAVVKTCAACMMDGYPELKEFLEKDGWKLKPFVRLENAGGPPRVEFYNHPDEHEPPILFNDMEWWQITRFLMANVKGLAEHLATPIERRNEAAVVRAKAHAEREKRRGKEVFVLIVPEEDEIFYDDNDNLILDV